MILCLCARGSLVARTVSPPRRTIGVAPSFHSIRQMRKNARTKTEQPNRPLTMRKEAVKHNHVGETMLQRDVSAVYLLRTRAAVSSRRGKFEQGVRTDCNTILKTHKHLFRTKRD